MLENARAALAKLAKKANRRLLTLERAKAAGKDIIKDALTYAHRALAAAGRKRFEENTKTLSDKQVAAAMRRVSRFLNMETSTLAGQRKYKKAYKAYQKKLRELQKQREAVRKKEGQAATDTRREKGKKGIASMTKKPGQDYGGASVDRFYNLFNTLMSGTIGKVFSYSTIAQTIDIGIQSGKSDNDILLAIAEKEQKDNLTRDELLNSFGPEAREAAEAEEWESAEEPPRGRRRKRGKKR